MHKQLWPLVSCFNFVCVFNKTWFGDHSDLSGIPPAERCYLSLKDRLSITEKRLYSLHLITFRHNLLIAPRSEAESALLVWSRVVEQWPHVWPVLPGGELLPPKCQEDHHHPPAAGRCAPPGRGPQWTAAQDERPSVSQKHLHEELWGCYPDGFWSQIKCGSWHKLLLSRVVSIKPT